MILAVEKGELCVVFFSLSVEPVKLIHLRRFSSDPHTVTVDSSVPYRFVSASDG